MIQKRPYVPEHQRLELEVPKGGVSLLHDKSGMPKVSKPQRTRELSIKDFETEPVLVKSKSNSDDGFLPPQSNFVSVGNVEQSWYSDKVTGPQKEDEVDIEALQGLNPLVDSKDSKSLQEVKIFSKRLDNIKKAILTELGEVLSLEDFSNLKVNTFGNKGVLTENYKVLGTVSSNNRPIIGEKINDIRSELELEFQGKYEDLNDEEEFATSVVEWPQDMAQVTKEDAELYKGEKEKPDFSEDIAEYEYSNNIPEIEIGNYLITVDGKILDVKEDISAERARTIISKLLLEDGIEFDRICLLKRVGLDFGVLLMD